ncbi:hypothetical protein V8D89_002444 [Ganoderma adspersum]
MSVFIHVSTGPYMSMCSPIGTIPVELLLHILVESQRPRSSHDKGPFEDVTEECQRPVTNWAPLMRVCRRFRNVIVNGPSLWSRIPVTNNLVALQQRLSRSQGSYLDLLFHGPCDSALPFILPHAFRIRAIVATPRFHIDSLPSVVPLLQHSLPALERVHLNPTMNINRHSDEWHKLRDVGSVLDETLHPRVNAVTSPRLLLPLKQSGFWSQQLLHLDIRSNYGIVDRSHRDDILALLKSTPLLEYLAITFPERANPPDFNLQMQGVMPALLVNSSHFEPAPLPRLRVLKLLGPAWLSGPVLHGIDTPSLEKLHVHTTTNPHGGGESVIVGMFPTRLLPVFAEHRRLHIHAGERGKGFRLGDCHCDAGRVSSDRLYLRVHTLDGYHHLSLRVLCRLFGDVELESLELSYFIGVDPEECGGWREVLETFPGLRRVTLSNNERHSGAAMLAAIEALQKEGLNPEMEVVMESAPW